MPPLTYEEGGLLKAFLDPLSPNCVGKLIWTLLPAAAKKDQTFEKFVTSVEELLLELTTLSQKVAQTMKRWNIPTWKNRR
jgi:hypothetical protein